MGRHGRGTVARWAGTLVVALLICGCSATEGGPDRSPELPPPGHDASVVLPLDGYRLSPTEQERLDRAQAARERECLSRFGLDWSGPPESRLMVGRAIAAARRAERFGLVDRAQATEHGYHPPPWSTVGLNRSQQRAHHREVPDDVADVLYGQISDRDGRSVPEGGCRGEAFRWMSSDTDPSVDPTLVTRLDAEADRTVAADPRVDTTLRAWRDCMRRAGYDYPTPTSAAGDDQWLRTTEPTAREIAVAEADITCKTEVDYLDTMVAVTTEAQQTLIDAHGDELDRVRQWLAARVERAAEALAVPVSAGSGR